jgi:3D (Asp-Asp-Asp) domain-containing protein
MMTPTIIQRSARWLFVSSCCVLCAGVAAAAAVRVADNNKRHVASTPAAPLQAIDTITVEPPALAAAELLRDAPVQTPVKATNLSQSTKHSRSMWMLVTAYCPCSICCGESAHGVTASGKRISYNHSRFVAADTSLLPFGTKLRIPGYNNARPVEVIDRGGAIEGNHIDVFFRTHDQALEWGKRWMKVAVE